MKVLKDDVRILKTSENFTSKQFSIKSHNLGHIVHILRDKIYSDKLLAVLREISTNAMDANIDNNKSSTPITVTLPSKLDPVLKIRDYGKGLSDRDVEDIFISYGESTKRNSNSTVGMLGLGSKAPFCYSDSFTVVSFNNGLKTIYSCVLDSQKVGNCLTMSQTPMKPTDEEGIEVIVPIKLDDCDLMKKKALNLFKYWNVYPELIGFTKEEIAEHKKDVTTVLFEGKGWKICDGTNSDRYNSTPNIALMGNIAYPLDFDIIEEKIANKPDFDKVRNVLRYLKNCSVIMSFEIGQLSFAPSREALEYTDYTIASITDKATEIANEIEKVATQKFNDCPNIWEAKKLYGKLFGYWNSAFHNTKDLFTGKLMWNNIVIQSDQFNNLHNFDSVHGKVDKDDKNGLVVTDHAFSTYDVSSTYATIRQKKCHTYHGYNSVSCDDKSKILVLDTIKSPKPYIRVAVKHIKEINPDTKYIYTLTFKTQKAKDSFYKECNFDSVPVIKYEDIADTVKNKIVRTKSTTGKTITTTSNGKKNVSYVTPVNYYRSYRSGIDWDGRGEVDFNVAKDFYYVELKDNCVMHGKSMNSIVDDVKAINKYLGGKIDKVYGLGQDIMKWSMFNKSNWIDIEQFLITTLTKEFNSTSNKYALSYKQIKIEDSSTLDVIKCKIIINKLQNKNGKNIREFCNLLKGFDKTKENFMDSLNSSYDILKKIDVSKEKVELEKLIKLIDEEYPMLLDTRFHDPNYDDKLSDETNDRIVEYIELKDKK